MIINDEMYGFSKVSHSQYDAAIRSSPFSIDSLYVPWEDLKLPKRATAGSAGYDIYSPVSCVLRPGETVKFPTGIKCSIPSGYFLLIVPRSGMGFRTGTRLSNTAGVIDCDYTNSDNEGHIQVKLYMPKIESEDSPTELFINKGDAVCQGIVVPYCQFINEEPPQQNRNGGFGSTSK